MCSPVCHNPLYSLLHQHWSWALMFVYHYTFYFFFPCGIEVFFSSHKKRQNKRYNKNLKNVKKNIHYNLGGSRDNLCMFNLQSERTYKEQTLLIYSLIFCISSLQLLELPNSCSSSRTSGCFWSLYHALDLSPVLVHCLVLQSTTTYRPEEADHTTKM